MGGGKRRLMYILSSEWCVVIMCYVLIDFDFNNRPSPKYKHTHTHTQTHSLCLKYSLWAIAMYCNQLCGTRRQNILLIDESVLAMNVLYARESEWKSHYNICWYWLMTLVGGGVGGDNERFVCQYYHIYIHIHTHKYICVYILNWGSKIINDTHQTLLGWYARRYVTHV